MRSETPLAQPPSPIQGLPPAPSTSREAVELPPAPEGQRDLVRLILAILFVTGLIAASVWIVWPFLPATIWATTLVVATWPLMLRVQQQLWHRRWLAVVVIRRPP